MNSFSKFPITMNGHFFAPEDVEQFVREANPMFKKLSKIRSR